MVRPCLFEESKASTRPDSNRMHFKLRFPELGNLHSTVSYLNFSPFSKIIKGSIFYVPVGILRTSSPELRLLEVAL